MKGHFIINIFVLILPLATPQTLAPLSNFSPECSVPSMNIVICSKANFTTQFPQITNAIQIFTCEGCTVPALPANAFRTAVSLNTVRFQKTHGLLRIDATAFKGLAKLVSLEINNIELKAGATSVDLQNLLSDLADLKTLVITKVLVDTLPSRFIGASVKKVVLDSTSLQTINQNAFAGADKLEELSIKNPVSAIPFSFMSPLKMLRKFELHGGKSNTFTIPSAVNTLQELILSRCSITQVNLGAFGGSSSSLRILRFDYSPSLDPTKLNELETLTKLETLSFTSCTSITSVPAVVKKLKSLKNLGLSQTHIQAIQVKDFPQFGVLQSLQLQIITLNNIHIDAFDHLNLTELHLSKVNIPSIFLQAGDSTSGASWKSLFEKVANTLQTLRMVKCQLKNNFWDHLSILRKLQRLALDHNKFTGIQDFIFGNLTELTEVTLGNNQIVTVNQTSTYGIPYAAKIGLDINLIKTVDNCTFAGRQITETVNLDGNPFECDCRLDWLRAELAKFGPQSNSVTCTAPPKHNSKRLVTIAPSDLTCGSGGKPPPCTLIPVTTPVPPPPPVTFYINQKNNEVRVIVNSTMQRWYRFGIVFYSVMGDRDAFKASPVFEISAPSSVLENMVSGKNYNICVLVSSNQPSIQPVVLNSAGNDRRCRLFLFLVPNMVNLGLVAGLSTVGAILLAVVVVLLIWCGLRRGQKAKDIDSYPDKEDIYEEYVYPPSSSIYSPATPSSTKSHPVPRRFVRASEISRAGTQSTVLTSPTGASRYDISRSTVSLAVQNRHTAHSSTLLSGRSAAPDTRKFMSMHDLAAGPKRPSNYLPSASRSMDELAPRQSRPTMPARRPPYMPDRERANRQLPNPNQEEYAYIEETEEYCKTPSPNSPPPPGPANEYLNMTDGSHNTTDSQYISMSSAHSLDQVGASKSPTDGYGPVVTPAAAAADTYGPADASPSVPPRVNGVSRRPRHTATESQLSLVNNRESDDGARHDNLTMSSTDIGSF